MITLYLVGYHSKKLDLNLRELKVIISKDSASVPGCTARLKVGDKLSVFDLLHGMCLPSGNDASF
jgi:D-alanyl-D-alanine carboxypeptidase